MLDPLLISTQLGEGAKRRQGGRVGEGEGGGEIRSSMAHKIKLLVIVGGVDKEKLGLAGQTKQRMVERDREDVY